LALTDFAEQADLTLIFSFDELRTKTANQLIGEYGLEEAIKFLLAGTGYTATFSNRSVINIAPTKQSEHEGNEMQSKKKTGLVATLAALFGASAVAQAPDDADSSVATLEEITVWAQKRQENLQDVPISISTLNGEELNTVFAGGVDVRGISARMPSLYVESTNGRVAPRFYIRGPGNIAFDANASQPVSVIYDDVVLENVSVKFSSNRPTSEREGYVDVSWGEFNTRRIEAVLSGALTDNVSAWVSLLHSGREHWIDNIAPGFEEDNQIGGYTENAARLQLQWTPSDETSMLVNVGYHDQFEGSTSIFRAGVLQVGGGVIEMDRTQVSLDSGERVVSTLDQLYGTVTVDHNFGELTLTSVTGYRKIISNQNQGDDDGGSLTGPFFPGNVPFLRDVLGFGENWALETGDDIEDLTQVTQEIRLASNGGERFNWLIGAYYFDEEIQVDQFGTTSFPIFGAPPLNIPTLQAQQFQDTRAWALFTSLDFVLSDQTLLKVGLRHSDDEKTHRVFYTADNGNAPPGSAGGAPFITDASDSGITGDVSLLHTVNENVNVYGRFATGFKAPSVIARDSVPDVGDSEYIWSVESGVKTKLLENRLRLNVSAYYYEITNHQLAVRGGAGNTLGLVNVENAIGKGLEVDLKFAATENILWTASFSLNDTEIDDPNLAIARSNSTTVLNAPNPNNPAQVLIDGRPLPGPKWIAATTLRVNWPVANGNSYFDTDWSYRGEAPTLLQTVENFKEPILLGGARFGYAKGDGRWDASLFVRNITDVHELTGILNFFNFNNQTLTGFVTDPRTWGLQVRWNY